MLASTPFLRRDVQVGQTSASVFKLNFICILGFLNQIKANRDSTLRESGILWEYFKELIY